MTIKLASFFSGCGGLDKGFHDAGYQAIWANEYQQKIANTYTANFPETNMVVSSISSINASDIPEVHGFIGSPPCQPFSEAGSMRGMDDPRGKVFLDYIRLVGAARPLFFVAENVSGIKHGERAQLFERLIGMWKDHGYNVAYKLMDCSQYGVPQTRERVFVVGLRSDVFTDSFIFPEPTHDLALTLQDAIGDLGESIAIKRRSSETAAPRTAPNHEHFEAGYSSQFLTRQRVRPWHRASYTIPASARHCPLHPQANPMIHAGPDHYIFDPESPLPYRRLSVRECARIQTFPDDFEFVYDQIELGYCMIGNAVPVRMANVIASALRPIVEPYCL